MGLAMQDCYEILEFGKILLRLESYAITPLGKKRCLETKMLSKSDLLLELPLLEQAQNAIDVEGHFPLKGGNGIGTFLSLTEKGYVLTVEQLLQVYDDLLCQKELKRYAIHLDNESLLHAKIDGLEDLSGLLDDMDKVLEPDGAIKDDASPELRRIRREQLKAEREERNLLNKLTAKYAAYLSDSTLTLRDGKYVLPIQISYKNQVKGLVLDVSNSGDSVFIEPFELVDLDQKRALLAAEEKKEIHRLLSYLSSQIGNVSAQLASLDCFIGDLDHLQARVLYGESLHGHIGTLSDDGSLFLPQAKHPLLDQEEVVANDFAFTPKQKVIVVSGPNAGGKTVALKTLGINAMMFQSGMFVASGSGPILPYFKHIFLDIGDSQSLEDNLSTFSGHMSNIASIMGQIGGNDLVLLDEVGTGTSPKEGEALAISLLEFILKKHSYAMISSHFEGVKLFSLSHKEVNNASMLYDEEALAPTYILKMGLPGESYGLSVAKRFGIQQEIIDRSRVILKEQGDYSIGKAIAKLTALTKEHEALKAKMEGRERSLIKKERELEQLQRTLDQKKQRFYQDLEVEKQEILEKAHEEINAIIALLNRPDITVSDANIAKKELAKLDKVEEDPTFDEEIKVGDYVSIPLYGILGQVVSLRGKKAEIATPEGKTFVTDVSKLQHALPPEKKKEPMKGALLDAISDQKGLSLECNLIGMRYDEAKTELDLYLDKCRRKGFKRVRIIHGYGSGALRKMTHEYLNSHSSFVDRYEAAGEYEGGSGATVVYLK